MRCLYWYLINDTSSKIRFLRIVFILLSQILCTPSKLTAKYWTLTSIDVRNLQFNAVIVDVLGTGTFIGTQCISE